MPSIVLVGAQWGDEGKGKLVDYLTAKADYVVRFQGGSNAGHTLVVDGVKTKLSLVPSGILREDVVCVIAAGVVVNPATLIEELSALREKGVTVSPERLVLDCEAHLVLDYHIAIDNARENYLGKGKIGTTGRGIGPAYEDRARRCGVRVGDLRNMDHLRSLIESNAAEKDRYLKDVLGAEQSIDLEQQWAKLEHYREVLLPFVDNASLVIDRALQQNRRVVFEGAQGTLLDQCFGTVPYVTSSHTIAGTVATGCGVGPKSVDYVLGIAKAYSTRVGSGPFPTELDNQVGEQIRTKGAEFGTVTGRPRRCGWFDAVALKKARRVNGFDSIAVTKLDVLSGIERLKICINYVHDGKKVEDFPSALWELESVEPEYVELEGWEDDLSSVTKWHQLPSTARLYLSTISEILGCPISIVSVAPDRESTLFPSGASALTSFVS